MTFDRRQKTGKKQPLKSHQLQTLRDLLTQDKNWRDLALLNITVDTCLRGFDLLNLCIDDVLDNQSKIMTSFSVETSKTSKTNKIVRRTLQSYTVDALECYLKENKISAGYLFPTPKSQCTTVKSSTLPRIVRLGLDEKLYGTYSLRRTRVPNYCESNPPVKKEWL